MAVVGVIAIETNTCAVTVNVTLLEVTPFNDALTMVVPTVRAEAMPLELSVATAVLLEAHVTGPKILSVVLSE